MEQINRRRSDVNISSLGSWDLLLDVELFGTDIHIPTHKHLIFNLGKSDRFVV